jgi:hypothetical protein
METRQMIEPAYDPIDTLRWMLEETRREIASDTATGPDGRRRRKTKAQRHDEQVRLDTLCEALWNVGGRRGSPESVAEMIAGA